MVTVKVAQRLYRMTEDRAEQLLKTAAELVPFGIYALKRGGYIELRNDKLSSRAQLKQARRGFKSEGFRVYCNGL